LNGLKIDEDTFKKLPVEEQRLAIYRAISGQFSHCDRRFKKIENRKLVNTVASAGGGFVGGFTALIAKILFWK